MCNINVASSEITEFWLHYCSVRLAVCPETWAKETHRLWSGRIANLGNGFPNLQLGPCRLKSNRYTGVPHIQNKKANSVVTWWPSSFHAAWPHLRMVAHVLSGKTWLACSTEEFSGYVLPASSVSIYLRHWFLISAGCGGKNSISKPKVYLAFLRLMKASWMHEPLRPQSRERHLSQVSHILRRWLSWRIITRKIVL